MGQVYIIIYQCFNITVFCIAVFLLFYISSLVTSLENSVANSMYQQHVISCQVAE